MGEGEVADDEQAARERMVDTQIAARGVGDPRVLAAMRAVPRHRFVPAALRAEAYSDHPLPIGHGATISQPYIVAAMTEAARVEPGARVLEIGAGSGYQTAVLAELGAEVYALELVEALVAPAKARLDALGYGARVDLRCGDGSLGWPERTPFSAILAAAAAPEVPAALTEQLAVGGRLVLPVGGWAQELVVFRREADGRLSEASLMPVRFVPMLGAVAGEGADA